MALLSFLRAQNGRKHLFLARESRDMVGLTSPAAPELLEWKRRVVDALSWRLLEPPEAAVRPGLTRCLLWS